MDQEMISYLDKRFNEIDQRFDTVNQRLDTVNQRFDEIDQRFDTVTKELKQEGHETRILVEGLRGDVQMIAEGLATGFDEGLKPLRSEYDDKIEEVRVINRLSHSDLQRRVGILEDWKERLAGTDPIAAVRERFGLKAKES
jgi:tetrahydromethanopterin S-methyltransferase subunit G